MAMFSTTAEVNYDFKTRRDMLVRKEFGSYFLASLHLLGIPQFD
jgi:hypothetical protein